MKDDLLSRPDLFWYTIMASLSGIVIILMYLFFKGGT